MCYCGHHESEHHREGDCAMCSCKGFEPVPVEWSIDT